MKKIAILIYPEFSIQEIGDIMYLFRWHYDIKTEIIASSNDIVVSEEGVCIKPHKTVNEFVKEDYYCLILPGCSDFNEPIQDRNLIDFLKSFKDDNEFIIGAICSAPIFLAYAGLMENRKFINSLFMEFNEQLPFINNENRVLQPIVIDGNIITAAGSEGRKFAIAVARKLGFDCSDNAVSELGDNYTDDDFIHRLPPEEFEDAKKHFSFLFNQSS